MSGCPATGSGPWLSTEASRKEDIVARPWKEYDGRRTPSRRMSILADVRRSGIGPTVTTGRDDAGRHRQAVKRTSWYIAQNVIFLPSGDQQGDVDQVPWPRRTGRARPPSSCRAPFYVASRPCFPVCRRGRSCSSREEDQRPAVGRRVWEPGCSSLLAVTGSWPLPSARMRRICMRSGAIGVEVDRRRAVGRVLGPWVGDRRPSSIGSPHSRPQR